MTSVRNTSVIHSITINANIATSDLIQTILSKLTLIYIILPADLTLYFEQGILLQIDNYFVGKPGSRGSNG